MKILYLFAIILDYVFCYFKVRDTDLNETVGIFQDKESQFGYLFIENEEGYIFESRPLLACGESISPPLFNITTKKLVALIKRGNCTFEHKVAVAQLSGYTGVIIYNYNNNPLLSMKAGDVLSSKSTEGISIPSRMVTLKTGRILQYHYTFTASRQNYVLVFHDNQSFNPQFYIIAFLGLVSLGFFIIGIGFGIKLCRDAIKRRANRLRKCHLKKIPLKKFVKGQDPYETCAICLDDFKDGDKLRILPCNHAYHSICIDPWLLKQKRNCPICKCRIKIPGRDEDSDSIDDTPPPSLHVLVNEQTPLINSAHSSNSSRYLINNETDIHFIPEHDPSTLNCYENLTYGISESEPSTPSDVKTTLPTNINHSIQVVYK